MAWVKPLESLILGVDQEFSISSGSIRIHLKSFGVGNLKHLHKTFFLTQRWLKTVFYSASKKHCEKQLVGGFNPFEKYAQNGNHFPRVRVENKKYLKPPTRQHPSTSIVASKNSGGSGSGVLRWRRQRTAFSVLSMVKAVSGTLVIVEKPTHTWEGLTVYVKFQ